MSEERVIDLTGPTDTASAFEAFGAQGGTKASVIADAVPRFVPMRFDTFKAEYALMDGTIVIHFFLPVRKVTELYWKKIFAEALEDVGQDHFQATAPRITAKYTEEVHSWWFRAQGYDHIIDLERFLESFFAKLDARMGPALRTQSNGV